MVSGDPAWPRILIVAPPPMNLLAGGGVTLHRLFGRWPAGHLAQIYSEDVPPAIDRAGAYYRVSVPPRQARPPLSRHAIGLAMMALNRVDTTMVGGRPSRALRAFVKDFQPEAILLILASHSLNQIATTLSRDLRIPLVSFVPDDYLPGYPQRRVRAGRLGRWAMHALVNRGAIRALDQSAAHLSISDAMTREYWVRYGYDFTPVYNSVEMEAWPPASPRDPGGRLRVVYSGSIFDAAQRDALYDVRDAVDLLRARGVDVMLEVYSNDSTKPHLREALQRPPASTLSPLVLAERLRDNLQAADVLVMPLSFDTVARSYMRLSMPGKLAEFMASGTPILAYGPPGVVQVDFVREHDAALVVNHPSVPDLADALDRLRTDGALRARLSTRAREVAADTFALPVVRRRFERVVFGVVGREPPA
jgi:glycosyltransferase involved in cell wall biosynthesis